MRGSEDRLGRMSVVKTRWQYHQEKEGYRGHRLGVGALSHKCVFGSVLRSLVMWVDTQGWSVWETQLHNWTLSRTKPFSEWRKTRD